MHHNQETGWQSGVQSRIMPGLPAHLVQELNAGTVYHSQFSHRPQLIRIALDCWAKRVDNNTPEDMRIYS